MPSSHLSGVKNFAPNACAPHVPLSRDIKLLKLNRQNFCCWKRSPIQQRRDIALQQRRDIAVQQGKRDPLDADIWDSWQKQDEDWDTEKFTEEELIDILFEEDGSAETAAQNILAIALSLLLLLAFVSVLWRIIIVSLALFSAAVRYSVVAVLLLVLAVLFL